MSSEGQILEVFLKEYECLKVEQTQRIGFRDNLLFATLGAFGAIVSFAVSNAANYYALLVIPWVCVIIGWTYIVNDEKISAIGQYVRLKLVARVKEQTGYEDLERLFGWEIAHRDDRNRRRRKVLQLVVDEITFVVSGVVALLVFWWMVPQPELAVKVLVGVELLCLAVLAVEIFIYADLGKGR